MVRGGRGVKLCHSAGTYQIVMLFLPPVVGCLLKKGLQNGGSRHPRTPPCYAPAVVQVGTMPDELLHPWASIFGHLILAVPLSTQV